MENRSIRIFYIPICYLFKVRLEGRIGKLLSWWFLYLVPTFGYSFLMNPSMDAVSVISFVILAAATVSYYELGYMFNDTFAIRKETMPTIRLNHDENMYFTQHFEPIFASRITTVSIMLLIYSILNPENSNLTFTICGVLFILPLFGLYNHIRGFASVLFYPILVTSRYIVFMLPFLGSENFLIYAFLLLLSYPVEISLERYSMPNRRYGIMARLIPDEESKTRFRAIYYLSILVLLFPIWIEYPYSFIPFLLIGIYRCLRYAVQKF